MSKLEAPETEPTLAEIERLEKIFEAYATQAQADVVQAQTLTDSQGRVKSYQVSQKHTPTVDQALLGALNTEINRLRWLNEGPDDYDTIDDTITSTQESRYNYDPYLMWSLNLFNNAAAGGANLLVRLTDSHGRIKQYKIVPGADWSVKDMRGSMGRVFRVVASSGSAEMIGLVTLRWPYGLPRP